MLELLIFLCALIAFCPAQTALTPLTLQVDQPRPFGYVIGDVVSQHVTAEVAHPFLLDRTSLPKPGRLSAAIELRSLDVKRSEAGDASRYDLEFVYQIFNSSQDLHAFTLPGATLKFEAPGKAIEGTVPAWLINVGPLSSDRIRADLAEMQPDRAPHLIETRAIEGRLACYALLATAALLSLACSRWGLPYTSRDRKPFARAYRELRALPRTANDRAAFQSGLRRLHRAFDETAGEAVFAERLDVFFAKHPRFAELGEPSRRFFDLSRREFFGGGIPDEAVSVATLLDLCRAWRKLEAT